MPVYVYYGTVFYSEKKRKEKIQDGFFKHVKLSNWEC